ncbi:hypothetical protein DES42_11028 [Zavarzinia compransoris]|nr:hypothetical protein DES42_11028 [Zavarzinia compransoris]
MASFRGVGCRSGTIFSPAPARSCHGSTSSSPSRSCWRPYCSPMPCGHPPSATGGISGDRPRSVGWLAGVARNLVFHPGETGTTAFAGDFPAAVLRWAEARPGDGPRVIPIVDSDCPCPRPAITTVEDALGEIQGMIPPLRILRLDDPAVENPSAFAAMLRGLPATPTLIVTDRAQVRYAGPAVSGGTCTGTLLRVVRRLGSPRFVPPTVIGNR